jgi:hypothetical protein
MQRLHMKTVSLAIQLKVTFIQSFLRHALVSFIIVNISVGLNKY